jgi:acyl-CoA synthetase (AMP-forming)/AMP-acid ligase II
VRPIIKGSDPAFLQYTGGTTGVSKGATLSQRNVTANILQCEAWFKPELGKIDGQLINVVALPLYHSFALTVCFFLSVRMGTMNLLIANARDLPGLIKTLKKYKVTQFPAVNTLYNALVEEPDFATVDFSRLRMCIGGGMAVQRATAEEWQRITGVPIVEWLWPVRDRADEAVMLFVVRKDYSLTEKEVAAYCKEQLTGYKRPKYVEFHEDLPMTNVGKILRKDLRDEAIRNFALRQKPNMAAA